MPPCPIFASQSGFLTSRPAASCKLAFPGAAPLCTKALHLIGPILARPPSLQLKVVCSLSHDELRPLFQVCKALRDTLRQAVRYHFNYSTPSRPTEDAAPPALGERQRRPPRSNVYQVMSRLSRGPRAVASG